MHRLLLLILLLAIPASAAPVEIWISSYQDKVYYEDMISLYKQTHPDFEGKVSAFGFRELPDKLAVAMKTGIGAPDIVQLDELFFGMYLSGDVPFVDVTDRIKAAGLDKTIVPERLNLFAYKGKNYGVPQSLGVMVLWYLEEKFEEFGISPDDLKTWDDFEAVAERLAKEKGQAMLGLDSSYFNVLLRQRGSRLFDANCKPLPDFDIAVETLEWLAGLQEKGIAVLPDRGSIFDPVFFSGDVINGEVFAVLGADWYGLDMIQQFSEEFEGGWRAMPLPTWKAKQAPAGRKPHKGTTFAGQGMMIYKDCKQVDASWDFINFVMTNKQANAVRYEQGNSFPAYKPAWTDKRFRAKHDFFGGQRIGKLLLDNADDLAPVQVCPGRPQAVFMLKENFFGAVCFGHQTAKEALTQLKGMLENPGPPPGQ
jgi:arabinosaccharide transport system substrate-binding protein